MTTSRYSLGVMVREVKRPTLEESLERIHSMGFECVQFKMSTLGLPVLPETLPHGKAGEIGATFWAFGLNLAAVSGTFNTAHPNKDERESGITGMRTLCEAANDMGTSIITICTGTRDPEYMWRSHPENETPEAWQVMKKTMREIIRIAEANSVHLAFEIEVSNIVNSVEKAVRLLDEIDSDNLNIVMDPANLLFKDDVPSQLEIFEKALSRLGSKIVLTHAKDIGEFDENTGELERVPAGKGRLDYPGFFQLLEKTGYQGPIIIHSLPEEHMPASRDFIASTLAQIR